MECRMAPHLVRDVPRQRACRFRPMASESRTRSLAVDPPAPNGHIKAMTTSGRHKKYLVISASLLTRS
jgi:hypothetical protein